MLLCFWELSTPSWRSSFMVPLTLQTPCIRRSLVLLNELCHLQRREGWVWWLSVAVTHSWTPPPQLTFLQLLQEHIISAHPAHALHYVTPPCCGAAHSGCTVGWPVQLLTAPPCSPAQCLYPSLGWILLRSLLDFEKAHIPRCLRVYHRRLATMLSILPPDAIVHRSTPADGCLQLWDFQNVILDSFSVKKKDFC